MATNDENHKSALNINIDTKKSRYKFKSGGSIQHNLTQRNVSNMKGIRFTNYNNQNPKDNIYIDDSAQDDTSIYRLENKSPFGVHPDEKGIKQILSNASLCVVKNHDNTGRLSHRH